VEKITTDGGPSTTLATLAVHSTDVGLCDVDADEDRIKKRV
jgi:hypothetical protein